MSFPVIPNITPTISLNRSQVIDLLLSSVAFEELGLAHIINAEREKLQAVLGNMHGRCGSDEDFENLKEINREVRKTLQTALKSQMLLEFKLYDIMELIPPIPRPEPRPRPCPPPGPPCPPPCPPEPCPPSDQGGISLKGLYKFLQ